MQNSKLWLLIQNMVTEKKRNKAKVHYSIHQAGINYSSL